MEEYYLRGMVLDGSEFGFGFIHLTLDAPFKSRVVAALRVSFPKGLRLHLYPANSSDWALAVLSPCCGRIYIGDEQRGLKCDGCTASYAGPGDGYWFGDSSKNLVREINSWLEHFGGISPLETFFWAELLAEKIWDLNVARCKEFGVKC